MPANENSLRSNRLILLVTAFFAIQIAVDLAHSVTAFPFVHYGMFSESFSAPDSLLRYEVVADGRVLDPTRFRIYEWDMIQQPLAAFDRLTATRDFAFDKSKFRASLPALYARVSGNLDNPVCTAAQFRDWYAGYLSRLTGHPVRTVGVNRAWYRYDKGGFVLLNTTPWI